MIIDTHSHLFDEAFDTDRKQAVERAVECGVTKILSPAIDSLSHTQLLNLCHEFPTVCLPMMGVHPTSVTVDNFEQELATAKAYLDSGERFWGIGEIGLDYYWSVEFKDIQREVLLRQLEWALSYGLPIAVHTRSAWDDMTDIIESFGGRGLRGVMHAFCGTMEHYQRICASGDFVFGIGGIVTYRNGGVAELVGQIPLERLVVETDSPYLSPVPYRGRRNESAYIVNTVRKIAEIKGISFDTVAEVTSANASRIFGL